MGSKSNKEGSNLSKSALDRQVQGNYYKSLKIQPIEFITANNLSFFQGNVIKYVCRYNKKNGIEDLKNIVC